MRSDLTKLLCEHERSRSSDGYHLVRRKKAFNPGPQDSPSREGMTHRYGSNAKSFGEFLSPLKGQVRKAVGRRWDSFYSDLCSNFDMRTVTAQHILQHLYQYCEKDLFIDENGVMCVKRSYGPAEPLRGSSVEIYVDPRDGIIKRNKWYRSYRTRRTAAATARAAVRTEVEIDANQVLRLIDGLWFHFVRADAPAGEWVECSTGKKRFHASPVRDLFTGQLVANEPCKPAKRYHAEKRSASRRMLQRAGLV